MCTLEGMNGSFWVASNIFNVYIVPLTCYVFKKLCSILSTANVISTAGSNQINRTNGPKSTVITDVSRTESIHINRTSGPGSTVIGGVSVTDSSIAILSEFPRVIVSCCCGYQFALMSVVEVLLYI